MVIYYIARFYSSFILSVACGKMRKNSCPNCPNCHRFNNHTDYPGVPLCCNVALQRCNKEYHTQGKEE